jgi:hypothetical protein
VIEPSTTTITFAPKKAAKNAETAPANPYQMSSFWMKKMAGKINAPNVA